MPPKAVVTVSWDDSADEASALQAVEFGCDDMMKRLELKKIVDPAIDLDFSANRRPSIGVAAIVIHEWSLLLTHRLKFPGSNTWCPPGGHLEWGETPEHTAERETLEETGIVVKAIRPLLPFVNNSVPDWDYHYLTLFLLCRYVTGEATVCEPTKCSAVEWVPVAEVEDRELFLPFSDLRSQHPRILEYCARSSEI